MKKGTSFEVPFLLYQSQFYFPFQDISDSIVQCIDINAAIQHGGVDGFILDAVIRGAQQVVSRQNSQYSGFSGAILIRNGLHDEIIGDDDAVKAHFSPEISVDARGEGSWILGIQSFYDGVADENGISTGFDAGSKGNQIIEFQLCETATVGGHTDVGIGIVAIARKMLQAAADGIGVHLSDGILNKLSGDFRRLAQGAFVEKGVGSCGNVTDRG